MSFIKLEKIDRTAIVTLNRPKSLNAFNYQMLLDLEGVLEELEKDPDIVVVIFTGAGEKSFSSGADLKERLTLTEEEVRRNVDKIREVFQKVADLPQPTIAAINGYAFGGGMELALSCDFRLAVKDVKLGLTETSWGIIPGAGGTQRLPRLIGEAKAKELIFTAKKLTAQTALEYGIVMKVTEREELMKECFHLANQMLENGPIALRQAKYAINRGMETSLREGLEIEGRAYEATIPTEDRIEALRAFQEKRKPEFKGK
mgnify:CR=1 FL=1